MKRHNLSAETVVSALREARGKPAEAAKILGVDHMAVRRAMVKHGIGIVLERRVLLPATRRNTRPASETRPNSAH